MSMKCWLKVTGSRKTEVLWSKPVHVAPGLSQHLHIVKCLFKCVISAARAETTDQQCIWSKAVTFPTRYHPFNWLQNSDISFFTLLQSWLWLGYLSNRCCKGSYRDQQFQVPVSSDIWWTLLASHFPHNRPLESSSPLSCLLWDL